LRFDLATDLPVTRFIRGCSMLLQLQARGMIIQRAEAIGLDWDGTLKQLQQQDWEARLADATNPQVDSYPSYYTQPFHAYKQVRATQRNLSFGCFHAAAAAAAPAPAPAAAAAATAPAAQAVVGGYARMHVWQLPTGRQELIEVHLQGSLHTCIDGACKLSQVVLSVRCFVRCTGVACICALDVQKAPRRVTSYQCSVSLLLLLLLLLLLQGNLCWEAAQEFMLSSQSVHAPVMDPENKKMDPL
jgi:hypothetical protein